MIPLPRQERRNEALLWVELKEESKLVLPSFVDLIEVNAEREIDFAKVSTLLSKEKIKNEISKIELFYNKGINKSGFICRKERSNLN